MLSHVLGPEVTDEPADFVEDADAAAAAALPPTPADFVEDPDAVADVTSLMFKKMDHWVANMGSLRHTFVKGFNMFVVAFPEFSWISGCSGSRIDAKCLDDITEFMSSTFGVRPRFVTLLACDKDADVQKWMMSQFSADELPVVLGDMDQLSCTRAENLRKGEFVLIPFSNGFSCGFSCLSKTKLNRHFSKNRKCIQDGDTSQTTTETYLKAKKWMCRSRPDLGILENLVDLEAKDSDADLSDAEFIIADFQKEDFAIVDINLEARHYGSWPFRFRKIFLTLNHNTAKNRQILDRAQEFLVGMALDEDGCDGIGQVLLSAAERERFLSDEDSRTAKRHKSGADGLGWRDEHRAIFELAGLSWPPELGTQIDYSFMNGCRMQECAFFYHTAFPVKESELDRYQTVDLNPTTSRTLGLGAKATMTEDLSNVALKSPWKTDVLRTIAGPS